MKGDNPGMGALREAIGGEAPQAFEALDAEALQDLAGLIESSRRRQQQALQQSLEDALRYLPRLLRGPVRRILFPERGR